MQREVVRYFKNNTNGGEVIFFREVPIETGDVLYRRDEDSSYVEIKIEPARMCAGVPRFCFTLARGGSSGVNQCSDTAIRFRGIRYTAQYGQVDVEVPILRPFALEER